MASVGKVVGVGVLVVVLAGAGYLTADAYDVVPGGLTLEPVPADPNPFPTVPALSAAAAPAALALTELDASAPMPLSGALQAQVDALVADARLGPTTGVVVADGLTGGMLATNLADEPRIPASTAKILTAVAALSTLDPASTLSTRVVQGGADNEITLVGGGDMMLAAGAGDPDAVRGRAGLADLAGQVAKELSLRGATSVRIRFDDTAFTGSTTAPGWAGTDVAYGYVAPVTALAVDHARTTDNLSVSPRYSDPSLHAARQFAARLAEAGVAVEGSPARATALPDARVLGEVHSATLAELTHFTLATSDNTEAEVLGRLVAKAQGLPATFEGATTAVLHALDVLGIDTSAMRLGDCSGLADGSSIPPRQLVEVLRLVVGGEHPPLRDVAVGMPIAGLTGTLADRYTSSPARGEVRAKTGSLTGVTSLAGIVTTDDGRELVFAVMADATPPGGQVAPRQAVDAFITGLAACGCR